MKRISSRDAQEFKSDAVSSREYVFADAQLNLAPITITGRYPEIGFTSNKSVDSVVYILSGEGVIAVKDEDPIALALGDQIHIAKGDAYFFEGSLEILYAATPPWTPKQTVAVE